MLTTTFAQKIISLHPLFSEQDTVLIPAMEGSWTIPDFDRIVSIQKAGDNFYLLEYGGETGASTFEAVAVKIGADIFLDLQAVWADTAGDEDFSNAFIQAFTYP